MKLDIQEGDCLQLMRALPDASIDLVVTDPPYKVISGGNGERANRPKGILKENKQIFQHNDIAIASWMPEVYRVLKQGTHCYIFTNLLNLTEMLNTAKQCGFKLHNLLIWQKNNCTPSQWYMKNCEYVLFLRKGKAKWINNIGASKTVHQFNNIIGNKQHPTEKPVDLLEMYIANSCEPGATVLDPFMGGGSTGIASVKLARRFVGMEIDPVYFAVAGIRIRAAVPQAANDVSVNTSPQYENEIGLSLKAANGF